MWSPYELEQNGAPLKSLVKITVEEWPKLPPKEQQITYPMPDLSGGKHQQFERDAVSVLEAGESNYMVDASEVREVSFEYAVDKYLQDSTRVSGYEQAPVLKSQPPNPGNPEIHNYLKERTHLTGELNSTKRSLPTERKLSIDAPIMQPSVSLLDSYTVPSIKLK